MIGNLIANLGRQMLTLAVGWELYERTDSALALGIVGLVQVLPVFALFLVTGPISDQYDRKTILVISQFVFGLAAVGLTTLSYEQGSLAMVYGCVLLIGISNAFSGPITRIFPGDLLPEDAFENSVTWSTSTVQLASVVGPAIGGLVIALSGGTMTVYVLNVLAAGIFMVLMLFIRSGRAARLSAPGAKERTTLQSLAEGITFLRNTPVILSTITLDLFAVLFGGAMTLLPIIARDILQVGPTGLGWLRAAPSVGAVCMAMYLAHRPPLQRAGPSMLLSVAGFGVVTVFFGLSTSFWVSLLTLCVLGALDNVSNVIRKTLALARTPNHMRGRVAAISSLFVSASNQLGGFESGLVAQFFGPVVSVVSGGIITVGVVFLLGLAWPELWRLRSMRESAPEAR